MYSTFHVPAVRAPARAAAPAEDYRGGNANTGPIMAYVATRGPAGVSRRAP